MNNDDVNLIVFNNLIFHKNYETDKPIHDAFLVLEKTRLGEDFPVDPIKEKDILSKAGILKKMVKAQNLSQIL